MIEKIKTEAERLGRSILGEAWDAEGWVAGEAFGLAPGADGISSADSYVSVGPMTRNTRFPYPSRSAFPELSDEELGERRRRWKAERKACFGPMAERLVAGYRARLDGVRALPDGSCAVALVPKEAPHD